MTEVILGLIIVAILVGHFLYVQETNKQFKTLVKAVMAKNLKELDISETPQVKAEEGKPELPDLVPVENASDEEFDKAIKEEIGG